MSSVAFATGALANLDDASSFSEACSETCWVSRELSTQCRHHHELRINHQ